MGRYDGIEELEPDTNGAGLRIGIVMGRFNIDVGDGHEQTRAPAGQPLRHRQLVEVALLEVLELEVDEDLVDVRGLASGLVGRARGVEHVFERHVGQRAARARQAKKPCGSCARSVAGCGPALPLAAPAPCFDLFDRLRPTFQVGR